MRSLDEWLEHQMRVHPQTIELGLERLAEVLERLKFPKPRVPVITIAGTNGKGSVAAYCASVLAAAGQRVGLFTSPHLRDYRERIRIDGAPVETAALVAAFERIEAARGEISLTFFEFNALAAFVLFDQARLDAWVLEIGMGGRLDAVNIIDPTVAVVVSIGLDHQEYLGSTLDSIAREKAGIFRRAVPAVLGSRDAPAALAQRARELGAPLKRLGAEFDFKRQGAEWSYEGLKWHLSRLPAPALRGEHQFANAATALAALEELPIEAVLSPEAVACGLARVELAGRFQLIEPGRPGEPVWILDVAHNPAAAAVLAANLRALPRPGRTYAVCGILADKDAVGVARALAQEIDRWWVCSTEGPRGTEARALAALIEPQVRGKIETAPSIAAGCEAARREAGAADHIVVFGSFHVVGPALDWLEAEGVLHPARHTHYTHAHRP
ncbi:MAG TPA: bifunctional tetrahydrofolate synthase/dihydrofolate synthase [Steroidobacteraceae bacterium]|nr:bifunctional tetrahydrofolate synthase/dihydrofolate synthase [Steroidobacteraceae bacterium]